MLVRIYRHSSIYVDKYKIPSFLLIYNSIDNIVHKIKFSSPAYEKGLGADYDKIDRDLGINNADSDDMLFGAINYLLDYDDSMNYNKFLSKIKCIFEANKENNCNIKCDIPYTYKLYKDYVEHLTTRYKKKVVDKSGNVYIYNYNIHKNIVRKYNICKTIEKDQDEYPNEEYLIRLKTDHIQRERRVSTNYEDFISMREKIVTDSFVVSDGDVISVDVKYGIVEMNDKKLLIEKLKSLQKNFIQDARNRLFEYVDKLVKKDVKNCNKTRNAIINMRPEYYTATRYAYHRGSLIVTFSLRKDIMELKKKYTEELTEKYKDSKFIV